MAARDETPPPPPPPPPGTERPSVVVPPVEATPAVPVVQPVEAAPAAPPPPPPAQPAGDRPDPYTTAPTAPGYSAPGYGYQAAPPAGPPPVVGAPTYGAQPYQQQPYQVGLPKGMSITSMILGIGGILFFALGGFLASVAAVITGHLASRRQPHAKGFWLTGIITGYVGIAFGALFLIFTVLLALVYPNAA